MTKAKSPDDTEWFEINRQQFESWFSGQRKTVDDNLKAYSGMQEKWADMGKAWQAFSPLGKDAPPANAFGSFFADAGHNLFNLMQQFQGGDAYPRSSEDAIRNWTLGMQKFFEGVVHAQSKSDDPAAQYRAFTENLIGLGPAFWMSFAKNPFSQYAASPHTAQMFEAQAKIHDPLGYFAAMPGIGYTREKQEDMGALYRLWVEYEGTTRKYNAEMAKIGLISLNRFSEYLKKPPGDSKPLSSIKDIFAKWIDVCEEVYGHFAMTDEYTQIYGESINALMRFKQKLNAMVDDTAEQMNLPTRKEIDSLHARMHDLRRENADLRKMVAELMGKPASKKGKKKK